MGTLSCGAIPHGAELMPTGHSGPRCTVSKICPKVFTLSPPDHARRLNNTSTNYKNARSTISLTSLCAALKIRQPHPKCKPINISTRAAKSLSGSQYGSQYLAGRDDKNDHGGAGGTPISFSHTDICCGKIAHLQAHVWR